MANSYYKLVGPMQYGKPPVINYWTLKTEYIRLRKDQGQAAGLVTSETDQRVAQEVSTNSLSRSKVVICNQNRRLQMLANQIEMSSDIIEELFENSQFIFMLKDQVERMVGETIIERSQTRYTGQMVEEINDLVSKMIALNVKDEVTSVTGQIHESIIRFREEGERAIQQMMDALREEDSSFKKGVQDTIKQLKKEIMDDRLRIQQKINSVSKNSAQTITNKLRDITNNFDENFPKSMKSMKSLKMFPLSTTQLPQLNDDCSQQLKERLKQFQKSIREIQTVLIDIENRLHERYEVNIASLWTVVAELEDKLLTEEKVESKLDQLKGSILQISSEITKEPPKKRSSNRFRRWLNL